jgi:hypothetical protein
MRELELSSTVVTDQKRAAELVSALHVPSSGFVVRSMRTARPRAECSVPSLLLLAAVFVVNDWETGVSDLVT